MGGCCCSDAKTEKHELNNLTSPPPEYLEVEPFLKRQKTMKSKVHLEVKMLPDETLGEGIKKTQGYETNLQYGQLLKWRSDFWGKCFDS